MRRIAIFQLAHFQTNLPDKWSRIVRTCTLVLALIVKWPLPCLKVAVIKVYPARVFSFWKLIAEGFAVCASDRVKKGLPVWSTSRPRTCSPRRSWWRRMTTFRWAGQVYLQHFLYMSSEQWAVSRLPLKRQLLLQHECAPLIHPDESMHSSIAKILLSHSSGGLMPDAKWRMKTLTRASFFFFFLFQHWKQ